MSELIKNNNLVVVANIKAAALIIDEATNYSEYEDLSLKKGKK